MAKTPPNNFISVKEFAERAGVSSQAIYKQVETRLKKFATKVGNRWFIDISALSEVYNIEENQPKPTEEPTKPTNLPTVSTEKPTITQEYIQTLKDQLAEKDRQIAKLQQSLDQEQRLHAADKQKLLEYQEQEQKPKKKWWPF